MAPLYLPTLRTSAAQLFGSLSYAQGRSDIQSLLEAANSKELPELGAPMRPLKDRKRAPAFPTGIRALGLTRDPHSIGGYGIPPVGFIENNHSSGVEWIAYWALSRILKDPPNPRQPPYEGGVNWDFQVSEEKYGQFTRLPGSSVSDFVIRMGTGTIVMPIETWHWHLAADAEQVAKDKYLRDNFYGEGARIVPVYDIDLLGDLSGAKACAAIARALRGESRPHPTRAGTGYQVRDIIQEAVQAS